MADFLTRLVERTLGVAPVVKPVITPLFSPDNLPDKTAVEFNLEDNSEQMTLTSPRFNFRQKSKNILPELPAVPEPEPNSPSFREVEDEFLIESHSAEMQTSSTIELSEPESKIFDKKSSSSAIPNPKLYPFPSPNKNRKFSQNSTQNLTQDSTQKFTQKDSHLIQSKNNSDGTVNQSSLRFSQKFTQTPDNYLDSKPKNGLMPSKEATLLPNQERVNLLEQHEVKQVHQRQALNSNLSQKFPAHLPQQPSSQTDQKQQPQKQEKIQALEQSVPPTIKVKIGRIEVRANTPAPRTNSPVQSPKPPRLSLDEYLRSNSGGKP